MITFVCGQLCSGKTLYSKTLTHISDCVFLEVGDLVRTIMRTGDRRILQDTKELASQIIDGIKLAAGQNDTKQLVVSGVRQKEILEAFPEATILWIECPQEERKVRYLDRRRLGDSQTFEEAEAGDIALGILEVKKYILNK